MPLHPDFAKILRRFQDQYGDEKGGQVFWGWVQKYGLDPERAYDAQEQGLAEAFRWRPYLPLEEVENGRLWKVWALFPGESMNLNQYSREELRSAARTLAERPLNVNHRSEATLPRSRVVDADFEDGAVECLTFVHGEDAYGGRGVNELLEKGEILHVSVEGRPREWKGNTPRGIVFTGLALLTRDSLPGDPLTRIEPYLLESLITSKEARGVAERERGASIEGRVKKLEDAQTALGQRIDAALRGLDEKIEAVLKPAQALEDVEETRGRRAEPQGKDGASRASNTEGATPPDDSKAILEGRLRELEAEKRLLEARVEMWRRAYERRRGGR